MQLDKATIGLSTVGAIVVLLGTVAWNSFSWAEEKHAELRDQMKEQNKVVSELKASNDLLRQIQIQNADIIKSASQDARLNREALIRIESKLEKDDSE